MKGRKDGGHGGSGGPQGGRGDEEEEADAGAGRGGGGGERGRGARAVHRGDSRGHDPGVSEGGECGPERVEVRGVPALRALARAEARGAHRCVAGVGAGDGVAAVSWWEFSGFLEVFGGFGELGFVRGVGFMVLMLLARGVRLRAKPVRTASGIAVVAVMSKPHRCPHIATTGNICVYCPGGPDSDFEYSTQSYTGYEPTSMRAIRARYV